MWRQGPPDAKFISSSILLASDRDEIVRKDSEKERVRADSCMCELAYLHLHITTNIEDLFI